MYNSWLTPSLNWATSILITRNQKNFLDHPFLCMHLDWETDAAFLFIGIYILSWCCFLYWEGVYDDIWVFYCKNLNLKGESFFQGFMSSFFKTANCTIQIPRFRFCGMWGCLAVYCHLQNFTVISQHCGLNNFGSTRKFITHGFVDGTAQSTATVIWG